jgi:ubiquinone/menaquinone biosynthesis C-methylase UbiE
MEKSYTLDDWCEVFFTIDRNQKRRRRDIDRFKINKDSKKLEIGCADGLNLKVLDSAGQNNIFGVDILTKFFPMVKKFKFICSDTRNLGIKNNSFNEIYCRYVLHHVSEPHIFSEMIRVLEPNGLIHIVEPWPTIFRSIADFLTLHILYGINKTLYYRRICLIFEKENYLYWLKNRRIILSQAIKKYDLKVVYKQISLFSVYITFKKQHD